MTLVKICGITNLKDARAAIDCGADMLGFVFAPSPRRIDPLDASRLASALPEVTLKVGVFVDEDRRRVEEIAGMCKLDYVQLHGSEMPQYSQELSIPFIKAFRARDESVLAQIIEFGSELFLLDSYDPHKAGGIGRQLDWALAAKAARLGTLILAGGLNPDNVAQAIETVKPYAVDVSTGVEISPGKKDHDKIRKFVTEAKQCARK